jgi:hypothetical protein
MRKINESNLSVSLIPPFLLLASFAFSMDAYGGEDKCTYNTYQWNVRDMKAVGHAKIVKLYSEVTASEKDDLTGCSVCEEDQVELTYRGLRPFKVCKVIAPKVKAAIESLQQRNAPLLDVVGYRPGMTRGQIDRYGNRTGFSNHSFGVALDINSEQNGLYDNCPSFKPSCRLIKGGKWDPTQEVSLTKQSMIVQEFERQGFRWGGEIEGLQKDFMHFSPTGY